MARVVPDWVRRASANKAVGLKHGFRSGLEEKIGKQIEAAGQVVQFETIKVPYVMPESLHKYTPDFPLENQIIIEGKGIFDAQDRAKHLLIHAQYPELDIRFVFTNAKAPITKGSKTSLAMWCEKHGFKYATKVIPAEWFKEPGPAKTIAEVLAQGPYGFAIPKRKTP